MFELNVEMKKHCRNFRKMKMGCGFFFFEVDLNTHVLLTLYLFIQMPRRVSERQSCDILENKGGSEQYLNMTTLIVVKLNFAYHKLYKQKHMWQWCKQ